MAVASAPVDTAPRLSPRMLRMAAGLALLVAILFLPLEFLYGSGAYTTPRIVAHTTHALLAIAGIVASYLTLNGRVLDSLALLIVVGMGGNALVYFALMPGYPSLLSNALTLLLFGATVICAWSPRRTALVGTLFAQGFLLVGLLVHRQDVPQDRFVFAIVALLFASVIAAFCASTMETARTDIVLREAE